MPKVVESAKNLISSVSKKNKSINKLISKSIDKKLDGPFDKFNLFESIGLDDHCWSEGDIKVKGPGVFCWIVIFWVIISTIINFLMYDEYRKIGLSHNQIMVRYLLLTVQAFLLSTFVYSMCKRCRGLESVLILILASFIQGILSLSPFFAKFKNELASLDGGNVIK